MLLNDLLPPDQLEEGWREKVATAAALSTLGYAQMQGPEKPHTPTEPRAQVQVQKQKQEPVAAPQAQAQTKRVPQFQDRNTLRDHLMSRAVQAGIVGDELVHFLGQMAHETMGWKSLVELGSDKYFARRYDKKYNPQLATILGNKFKGDGIKYKGRGFVHLTGRDNYRRAGKALGLPLEQQPELAAEPRIAADIAVWYWQNRVAPNIQDFANANVKQVTRWINPNLRGLDSRERHTDQIDRHLLEYEV